MGIRHVINSDPQLRVDPGAEDLSEVGQWLLFEARPKHVDAAGAGVLS